MKITINQEACISCGICVKKSPKGFSLDDNSKAILLDVNAPCITDAAEKCPVKAITVTGEPTQPLTCDVPSDTLKADQDTSRDVWVFAEQWDGKLAGVTLQLLGKGRDLADQLGQRVVAVLLGHNISGLAQELINHQADVVYVADDPKLAHYQTVPYAKIISELVLNHQPRIFLYGASSIGRDLAPRIAQRVRTGLTADCTDLAIAADTGLLDQTRPAFGGNIMATIETPRHRPQMATVRPGIMKAKPVDPTRKGEIIKVEAKLSDTDLACQILAFAREDKANVNLEEARIIVSGGRGVGSKEGFQLLQDLADVLDGELGGSRVAVECNWIDHAHQVGQTGKAVSPELYIACGISGAIQHQAGMSKSRTIVAINKDPEAQIMAIADYAIVGDLHEVIPHLIKEIKSNKPVKA